MNSIEQEKNQILEEYTEITNKSSVDSLNFIIKRRHQIINKFGKNLIKEMILNHRIYFKKEQKIRIINDYKKYIMTKNESHNSDLAIGYNIVNNVMIPQEVEKEIINFMSTQLPIKQVQSHIIKKNLVLNFIETKVLKKKKL